MTALPDRQWMQRLRRRLRSWYERSARDLPWRQTRDPYAIWISEVMLQQTQVATVIPYYTRFLARFPDIASLAKASEERVLRLWEGLGYYRRARQLHRAAQIIQQQYGGVFPTEVEAVRALPGIGRYTAGAILSIACDARQPILEANTYRLLSRWLAYEGDPASRPGQDLLWEFAAQLLPRKHVGQFNQALMDLGSQICRPRDPACDRCPVAALCEANLRGLQSEIPRSKRKPRIEQVRQACVVVWRRGRVLLRRCGPEERWAGLWDFPRFSLQAHSGPSLKRELSQRVREQTGVTSEPTAAILATLKHGVTRYRITLSCFQARYIEGSRRRGDLQWVLPETLEKIPLNVTGRKITAILTQTQPNS